MSKLGTYRLGQMIWRDIVAAVAPGFALQLTFGARQV